MLKYIAGPLWALVTAFAAMDVVGSVLMTRQPEFFHRWGLDNAEWGWAPFSATGRMGGEALALILVMRTKSPSTGFAMPKPQRRGRGRPLSVR